MVELYIENVKVDIDNQFSTQITLAIDDIKDFGAKNTTYSKTIIIAGTSRNNILLGNLFDIQGSNDYNSTLPNKNLNFNASVSAKAIIFSDNIQCFKGVIRITEVIVTKSFIEYECFVVGELGGFVSKLGADKMEDLDFSEYNHTYTINNIINSWSNTITGTGTGYYYPLIDYGNYSFGKKHWDIKTFRPSLYAYEYIKKIFQKSGYSFVCPLFESTRFKKLIVPHNRKTLQRKSDIKLIIGGDLLDYQYTGDGNYNPVSVAMATVNGGFTPNSNFSVWTYSGLPFVGNFIINIDGVINANDIQYGTTFGIYLNNTSTLLSNIIYAPSNSSVSVNTTISFTQLINNGDKLIFNVVGNDDPFQSYNDYELIINNIQLTIKDGNQKYIDIGINEDVVINDILPQNILQKDFLSSIIKLFNLYIFEDKTKEKNLIIMPFVDFYSGASTEDWSSKIDYSEPIRIKPMSELNARYYDFKFKSDADFFNDLYTKRYNETYGSYKYDSGFEFSKDSTTVELIFSGTPLVGYDGEDKVYSTIFKKNANVEEQVDSNIRLLQTMLVNGVAFWDIKNGSTTLTTRSEYPYAGHLDNPDAPADDIQFGVPKELFFQLVSGALNVNQFNVYWSSYMAEITDKDSKLLTCKAKLSIRDISNLDFSKLIYIDGSLFRLNKIIDFNASKEDTCTIELLKVINKIY